MLRLITLFLCWSPVIAFLFGPKTDLWALAVTVDTFQFAINKRASKKSSKKGKLLKLINQCWKVIIRAVSVLERGFVCKFGY